jgi:hypothetical protein
MKVLIYIAVAYAIVHADSVFVIGMIDQIHQYVHYESNPYD